MSRIIFFVDFRKRRIFDNVQTESGVQYQNQTTSAARKVDTKVFNLFLKVAQKVATINNRFKTGLKPA